MSWSAPRLNGRRLLPREPTLTEPASGRNANRSGVAAGAHRGHPEQVGRDASASKDDGGSHRPPTFMQRQALKGLVKLARKRPDEPLSPADWESYWRFASQRGIWKSAAASSSAMLSA